MSGVRVATVILMTALGVIVGAIGRRRGRARVTVHADASTGTQSVDIEPHPSADAGEAAPTSRTRRNRLLWFGLPLLGLAGILLALGIAAFAGFGLFSAPALSGPLPWVGGGLLLLAGGAYLLWVLPAWRLAEARSTLTAKDYLEIENNLRLAIIQAIGGVALVAGLYFTWQQANDARLTANETLRISQEGQITERFTRAIDQLGSDAAEVRLGGIYALERIARDSVVDRGPVLDVLAAFIRERAPWSGELQAAFATPEVDTGPTITSDVRSALLVIGRHYSAQAGAPCADLAYTNLSGIQLNVTTEDVKLSDVCFISSNLTWAYLYGVDLSDSRFELANLSDATLGAANLTDAVFDLANLQNANLSFANLTGASFFLSDLSGADLTFADLTGANFDGATIAGADLRGANIEDAVGLTQAQLDTALTGAFGASVDPVASPSVAATPAS